MKTDQTDWGQLPVVRGEPDFKHVLAVLRREKPERPTLFELFLNGRLHRNFNVTSDPTWPPDISYYLNIIHGFRKAGYDYATLNLPNFGFYAGDVHKQATVSLNEGAVITDRASFEAYRWPDADKVDYPVLDRFMAAMPPRMKLMICGPSGVLENVIRLVGFESLCYMILDDEQLAFDVFEGVGSALVKYYRHCVKHPVVGGIFGNDDWGFKSQTMLSPDDMRRFVFPWHKQIVEAAHAAGKPAVLHSCGCLMPVMDDVIDDLRYDGKHSYEDTIMPVETAYDRYHSRIAIMGGLDVDFICRSTPEAIYNRAAAMLKRAEEGGGSYALGTGNSVPEYVPDANYYAMTRAALDQR